MASVDKLSLSFGTTLKPWSGTYLKSENHQINFTGELELEGSDKAIAKTIQKAFEKELKSRVAAQFEHLNRWLKEKDKLLVDLVNKYNDLKKQPVPTSEQTAKGITKRIADLNKMAAEVGTLKRDYAKIVDDWVKNCQEQQGLIAMDMALKKARVDVRKAKRRRVILGKVVKGSLVVAGVALAITATVLTAGAAAPAILGVGIAATALSGISSLGAFGLSLKGYANEEKRLLNNVKKDMETISAALKPVDGASSSIAKHVTELRNLIKVREDKLKTLDMDLKKYRALAEGYRKEALEIIRAGDFELGDIVKRCDKMSAAIKNLDNTRKKMEKLNTANREANALLGELERMIGDLDKISTQQPTTILKNIKGQLSTVEGWLDVAGEVGDLAGGITGVVG